MNNVSPVCSSSPSLPSPTPPSFLCPVPSPPFLLFPILLSFQGECHVSEEACNGRMRKTEANVRQLRPMMAVRLWTSDWTSLRSSFLIKMINELLNANPSWIYEFILWPRKHQVSPFLSSCGYGFSRICFYSHLHFLVFAVVQLLSPVQLFSIPWTAARWVSLSFIVYWSLLKLMSIESVMPSNHLILSRLSPFAVSLSQNQGLLQWVGSLHCLSSMSHSDTAVDSAGVRLPFPLPTRHSPAGRMSMAFWLCAWGILWSWGYAVAPDQQFWGVTCPMAILNQWRIGVGETTSAFLPSRRQLWGSDLFHLSEGPQ